MYVYLVVSAHHVSKGAGDGKHKVSAGAVPFCGALPSGDLKHVPWTPGGT